VKRKKDLTPDIHLLRIREIYNIRVCGKNPDYVPEVACPTCSHGFHANKAM